MANENNNSKPAWVRRLDELKNLEGETAPDINEAWERYESMFKKEPLKKRHQWTWMAAACLAGILLFIWQLSNDPKDNPLDSKVNQPLNKENKILQPSDDATQVVTTSALPTTAMKSEGHITPVKTTKELPKIELAKPVYLHPGTEATSTPQITTAAIKNSSKPQNKFAVVYNNELEESNGARDLYQAKWTTKAQSQHPTPIQSSILKLKIPL